MIQRRRPKERFVYVLDYMKEGNPLDRHKMHRNKPIVQVVGEEFFILMEAFPNRELEQGERLDLESPQPSAKIDTTIYYNDLTSVAKGNLEKVIEKIITDKENLFVAFFNKSEPLTLKFHALELLPGIGKKTLRIILDQRKAKIFESYKDIENRTGLKNVSQIIKKRIMSEIIKQNIEESDSHEDKY
ncbi:DUF655 domain-containing protein, partial [Acidianus sp. RZ1]